MAFNLTNEELQRLQHLQRLHLAQQLQQAAASHQSQTNNHAAQHAARDTQGRRRRRQAAGDTATERMISEVGLLNRRNRHAFKAWYRRHKQALRGELAQSWARMSADAGRYGVSRPEWFIMVSSGDELRDFLQGLAGGQKLALFDLAMVRQAEKGDITHDKVAVFNTVNGRPGDLPLGTA
ncbi:hypothetical protein INS49_001169 [Diaporthe citri]|uniref:uncharacterized protein n=1 Tax=Diaporthe citri TaxID=83186 RepID=UPI001C805F9C|nr:uncharacterized protein INS49_001169 [Diaporthe citri]KAG6366988.1 hypothetical protein INS49_001169 [Diaporthe citri]